ncbi:hypothetical protein Ancab_000835 [Ancistrocladus abbreviatus]
MGIIKVRINGAFSCITSIEDFSINGGLCQESNYAINRSPSGFLERDMVLCKECDHLAPKQIVKSKVLSGDSKMQYTMAEGALREMKLEDDDVKWKARGENDATEDFELDLTQAKARKIVKGGSMSPDYVADSDEQDTQEDIGENALGWTNPFDIAQDKLQEHGPGYILEPMIEAQLVDKPLEECINNDEGLYMCPFKKDLEQEPEPHSEGLDELSLTDDELGQALHRPNPFPREMVKGALGLDLMAT